MTSFFHSGFSTAQETLISGEVGVVLGTASIVTTASSITSTGITNIMIQGAVISQTGSCVTSSGGSARIVIGATGSVTAFNTDAIALEFDTTGRFVNHGIVTSELSDAVDLRSIGDVDINFANTGQIFGNSDGLVIGANGGTARIVNSGSLIGNEGFGIAMDVGVQTINSEVIIHNDGLISGFNGAFNGGNYGVTLENTGTMMGRIVMGVGDSIFRGHSGIITGDMFGGFGNDLLQTGQSDDRAFGEAGNDTLRGNAGDDALDGGTENDVLYGGNDADLLRGDLGNDLMYGGSGDDTLVGGPGRDQLTGGINSDAFVFSVAAHSPNGANADTITDFVRGSDRVDLAGLVAGVLTFVGTGAFSGGTVASVRYSVSAGNVTVFVDATGDAVADMRINMDGLTALAATDFVL